jgi:hypothetical protein
MRSLKPLADHGLARFYAHLPFPWEFTVGLQTREARFFRLRELKREKKESVERYLMGNRYDELYANGREEPSLSFWNWSYYGVQ